jgi:hypothetical protein
VDMRRAALRGIQRIHVASLLPRKRQAPLHDERCAAHSHRTPRQRHH